jgi:hypothetical protein
MSERRSGHPVRWARGVSGLLRSLRKRHGERADDVLLLLLVASNGAFRPGSLEARVLATFRRRTGITDQNPVSAIARHLEAHPLPTELVQEFVRESVALRSSLEAEVGQEVQSRVLGNKSSLTPVNGSARDPGSLFSLRLQRSQDQ